MDTMTVTTADTTPDDELYPWEPTALPARTRTTVHILAPAPVASFTDYSYPGLTVVDVGGPPLYDTRLDVTLTGSAEQRTAFAAQLRAVADAIDAWTK